MSRNVQQLVPWGKVTATALLQQVEARRREAEADGEEFVLALCWAKKSAGGNWRYSEAWTTGPGEVLFYMSHALREQLKP
jgi:hypothetical protein